MSVCDILLMDDIEDLIGEDYAPRKPRDATVRVRRRQMATAARAAADPTPQLVPPICDSVIPGTQTVHVRTWGCTHNGSDSEYMTGLLAQYGYNITDDADSADLWLLNSCTVKSPAEQHFRNEIARGRGLGKHVVVAGCVPQGAPKSDYLQGLSVIGVQQIDRVVEVVEETLKGHTVRLYGQKKEAGRKLGGASLLLPKVRRNPLIEIIPINTGCLNQCTYCKTRHARGQLGSYPVDEIVERARQAFAEGVCELWLTSEDTGAYGRDIGSSLPELLKALLPEIPPHAMMRVGMTNPPYILDHLHEIAEVLRHPRVYAFLHVPVQSGSDSVLADMRREYTVQQFRDVVDHLRSSVPDISICTDIICGFPTETAEDFCETLALCRDYRFPSLFINQFYPRPGTPAARMTRVPTAEVKRRTRLLTELFHSYRPYDHQIGQRHSVLVTELSHDKLFYVGHNKAYQQVLVPMDSGDLMGRRVTVHIESASKFSMTSRLCEDGVGVSACITRSPAAQNQQLSSTSPSAVQNQQLSSASPPATQNQKLSSTSPPAAQNQQLSSTSPPAAQNQQLPSTSPPAAQNQQLSSASPPATQNQQLSSASSPATQNQKLSSTSLTAAQNQQLPSISPPAALSCWLTEIDLTCALLLALCALSVSYLLVRVADVCTR